MTNWQWVTLRFALFGTSPYIRFRNKNYGYAGLIVRVSKWRKELERLGVTPGQTISLTGEYTPNIVALTLALILNNNIVVPLDCQNRLNLESFLSIARVKAGFEFRQPGCSMCLAMNPDKLQGREVCASSSNRNFKGRQGSSTGRTLLMSPAMVAAAAITGEVTDARQWFAAA